MAEILGIDIGGTGVKGAIVDTEKGILISERIKYPTPQPSLPNHVVEVVDQIISDHGYKKNRFGCGFPAIIKKNTCRSASNIDNSWIGLNLRSFFLELISNIFISLFLDTFLNTKVNILG